MRRKIPPAFLAIGAIGALVAINAYIRSMDVTFKAPSWKAASGGAKIPPGRTWRVKLKDGRQVRMTSAQLDNAINAKAVRTYSLLRQTA